MQHIGTHHPPPSPTHLRAREEPLEAGDVRGPVRVHHERVPPAGVEHALWVVVVVLFFCFRGKEGANGQLP